MILDSLFVILLGGALANVNASTPTGWILDSVVVTVSYEIETLVKDAGRPYFEPTPNFSGASRNFALGAQHPRIVTGQQLDLWRLRQQWGMESRLEGTNGSYSFSRHPLGSGWDLRFALIHESVPTHAQEARWALAHGFF